MGRLRVWLTISGVLILAAGASVGMLAGSHFARSRAIDTADLPAPLPPSYFRGRIISSEEVWDDLGLDEEQKSEIARLLAKNYGKQQELREELEKLSSQVQFEVLAVLSTEQRERWSKIQEEYAVEHIEAEVVKELALLRPEVVLRPEQEPLVYKAFYDSFRQRRDVYCASRSAKRDGGKFDRETLREQLREISRRRDAALKEHLDEHQFSAYLKKAEQRRRFYEKHSRRSQRGKKDGDGGEDKQTDARAEAGRSRRADREAC